KDGYFPFRMCPRMVGPSGPAICTWTPLVAINCEVFGVFAFRLPTLRQLEAQIRERGRQFSMRYGAAVISLARTLSFSTLAGWIRFNCPVLRRRPDRRCKLSRLHG